MVTVRASWLLITCWCFSPLVRGLFVWPVIKNNDHIPLAESVIFLTRNYLSKVCSTVVVLEQSRNEEMRIQHSSILEHILTNLQATIAVQLYSSHSDDQPWDYYIFVVDGLSSFEHIGWNFPTTYFERNSRVLIMLTQFPTDLTKTLKQIFKSCLHFNVLNANVILKHPVLGVCMYQYSVFSADKCNEVQPYPYFCFKDGIHKLREVFPHKLKNYWGCPLRVTARQISPNVKVFGNHSKFKSKTAGHSLGGTEGDLLRQVSKTLNFTIHLVSLPEERTFYRNSTPNGCYEQLLNGKADIALGGFGLTDPKRKLLSPSFVFHHSPLVFIVRQRMEVGSMSRLSWPFKGEVWTLLALYLFVSSLALLFLRVTRPEVTNFVLGYRNRAPVTNFIAVFLGYPMPQLPVRNFARYVLTVWLLMSLVIRNAYQGSLYDSFRTDRIARTPRDYDDLLKHNFKLLISRNFIGSELFPPNQSVTTGIGSRSRLMQIEENEVRYASVATIESFITYLEENDRNGSQLVMGRNPVLMFPVVFYFPKHSIFVPSINRKLKLLNYAGITKLIYAKHVKDYVLFRKRNKDDVTPEAIKFFRLSGIYEICGYILVFGIVVFILELLSVRFENLGVLLNWLG